jgi:hypothetical protein
MNTSRGKQLGHSRPMANAISLIRRIAVTLGASSAAVLGLAMLCWPGSASAEPIFKRGRPPIYPYFYSPARRPGGYSFYFGFVPYQKGDYETQALQRQFPSMNYPPSMRYWNPQDGSPIP